MQLYLSENLEDNDRDKVCTVLVAAPVMCLSAHRALSDNNPVPNVTSPRFKSELAKQSAKAVLDKLITGHSGVRLPCFHCPRPTSQPSLPLFLSVRRYDGVRTGALRVSGTYSLRLEVGDHHNQEGFSITSFGHLPTLHFNHLGDKLLSEQHG